MNNANNIYKNTYYFSILNSTFCCLAGFFGVHCDVEFDDVAGVMPDAPQRIATDTSQKLPIRFGETLKKYIARGLDKSNLVLIPLVLAGYARYLKGIKDDGTPFDCSPDPMLEELQAIVAPLEIGKPDQDWSALRKLYSRKDIFAIDLYEAGLGEKIEGMVKELFAGKGAVRATLHKYVTAR